MKIRAVTILVLGLTLAVGGCQQQAEPPPAAKPPVPAAPVAPPPAAPVAFKVTSVDLGNAISADKKVTQPTTTFAPSDTIYASVASEGSAPSVALTARWTYGDGQLVNEGSQTIAPSGPSITEFHIAKPSGWPAGTYKVEISANGSVVATKQFTVG